MKPLVHLCQLAVVAGLTACASAPVHYHTLLAPGAPVAVAGQAAPFLIEVLPVGIPVQLDQSQLVVRQGDSASACLFGQKQPTVRVRRKFCQRLVSVKLVVVHAHSHKLIPINIRCSD